MFESSLFALTLAPLSDAASALADAQVVALRSQAYALMSLEQSGAPIAAPIHIENQPRIAQLPRMRLARRR